MRKCSVKLRDQMGLTNLGDTVPSEHGHRSESARGASSSATRGPISGLVSATCQVMSTAAVQVPGEGLGTDAPTSQERSWAAT